MNDFDYEVMEKKRLALQARHRKCGSKSKKCTLSTDYMTHKQWKERNGEVMSYQFNKPVQWKDFKAFPKHIQTDYLANLIAKYNANATSLAKMFGVKPLTVRRHIEANQLDISFHVGKSMSSEEKLVWDNFICGCEPVSEQTEKCENLEQNSGRQEKMVMSHFSISFSGKINVNMIANSLRNIIGDDAVGTVEIVCTL